MKKAVLLLAVVAAAISLFACSSCPVPSDAPRTYSLHLAPGDTVQK